MEKTPVHNRVLPKIAGVGMASLALVATLKYLEMTQSSSASSPAGATSSEILPGPNSDRSPRPSLKPCLTQEKNLVVVKVSNQPPSSVTKQNLNIYTYYPTGQIDSTTSTTVKTTSKQEISTNYTYYPTGSLDQLSSHSLKKSPQGTSEKCLTPTVSGINIELIKKSDIFTDEQINQLIANSGVYMEVAKKYNLPWQLLATIHWRETNLSMVNPGNNNGLFQVYDAYFKPGRQTESNFISQVEIAARLLADNYAKKAHITGRISDGKSINMMDLGNLLMAYNGQSSYYYHQAYDMGYHSPDLGFLGSPYVSNLINRSFDSRFNGNWEQIRYDNGYAMPADQRPGTLPVFVLLMQATDPEIKLDFSGFKQSLAKDITKRF